MDRLNVNLAFNDLERLGYYAKQRHWCCQSCGWADVPDGVDNVVFYHEQDYDDWKQTGDLYLAWSGDGDLIVSIFHKYGLATEWNGTNSQRIMVKAS